jgi:U5 small nuclear ribonucleoprotein component
MVELIRATTKASQSAGDAADAYVLDDEAQEEDDAHDQQLMEVDKGPSNAVILHEDKQYYPSASDVYGPDVEVLLRTTQRRAGLRPRREGAARSQRSHL